MPFAGFDDFEACVVAQRADGHDDASARRICGKLQDESERGDTVERLDFVQFSKVERTPQGGLRVPAHLTRVGVFAYKREDGSTVRELRHPDDVFAEDSLSTLRSAPVTDLHPARAVSPSNWRRLSIGHVSDNVKQDGKFVSAPLMIQDAEAIASIEREKDPRRDLSCGYSCKIDETPGEFEGERFDVRQRSIRYNHVALGPKGWGRAGDEVALRLDSNGNQIAAGDPSSKPQEDPMPKYTIDDVTYDTASPEFLQALTNRDKRVDEIAAKAITKIETMTAERDAVIKERDDGVAKLKEANDPKRLDGLVADRVALVTVARRVLGADAKLEGKSDRDIMVEAIRHDAKDFDAEGKSDDYVQAYFEASTKSVKRHDEDGKGIGAARSAAVGAVKDGKDGKRADADDDTIDREDADAARLRMLENNRDAATKPLRFSRSN